MKSFTTIKILLLVTLVAMSSSCILDKADNHPDTTTDMVTLRVAVHAPMKATRAGLTSADEYAVDDIQVLAFHPTGDRTLKGSYVGALVAGYPALDNGSGANGGKAELRFDVGLPSGNYDLMVVANGKALLAAAKITPGTPLSEVENAVTMTLPGTASAHDGWSTDPSNANYKKMPMWGYIANVDIADPTQFDAQNNRAVLRRAIAITRMVAKVTVALDPNYAAKNPKPFVLQSVRVYNYNKMGYLMPSTTTSEGASYWNNPTLGVSNGQPSRFHNTSKSNPWGTPSEYIERTLTAGETALNNEIYLFESPRGVAPANSAAGEAFKNNICLVIGGQYDGGPTTWYRIDFAQKSGTAPNQTLTYIPVLRNNLYEVTVKSITSDGKATPIEALESIPANVDATVLDWNKESITEITSNGIYMLGVSKSRFEFLRSSRLATESYDDNILGIATDYYGGWKAEVFDDNDSGTAPATTTAARNWLGTNPTSDNGNYPNGNEVKITLAANTTGDPRSAWICITAGILKYNIRVTQTTAWPEIDTSSFANRITWDAEKDRYILTVDPTDAGLLFKYGSVVGVFSGAGANQVLPSTGTDSFHPEDVAWSPTTISGSGQSGWESIDLTFAGTSITDAYHTPAIVKAGKGDPCRLVGLDLDKIKNTATGNMTEDDIDNHIWRLPTDAENQIFTGYPGVLTNTLDHWTKIGGISGGSFPTSASGIAKFLPAAGLRNAMGTVHSQGTSGYYRSSTGSGSTSGYYLSFGSSNVFPSGSSHYGQAMAVRCVNDPLYRVTMGSVVGFKVSNGTNGADAISSGVPAGTTVTYTATNTDDRYTFGGFATNPNVADTDPSVMVITFTMPASDIYITPFVI
jgi:hypothetical protein